MDERICKILNFQNFFSNTKQAITINIKVQSTGKKIVLMIFVRFPIWNKNFRKIFSIFLQSSRFVKSMIIVEVFMAWKLKIQVKLSFLSSFKWHLLLRCIAQRNELQNSTLLVALDFQ